MTAHKETLIHRLKQYEALIQYMQQYKNVNFVTMSKIFDFFSLGKCAG